MVGEKEFQAVERAIDGGHALKRSCSPTDTLT